MSRNCSRSLSSADEYPRDPSPRTECQALSGTTLVCMWILKSNFNSLSEDHQVLANKFPKKTDDVLGGNRLRSLLVMECLKPERKVFFVTIKISFDKTIDCII